MNPFPKMVTYIAAAGSLASGILAFLADPAVSPYLASLFSAAFLAKFAAVCGLVAAAGHSLTGTGGKPAP